MANPRRTPPVTRSAAGSLSLKTNMVLKKGATFHSPSSPASELIAFKPPSLPHRSQTSLDDVVDSHRRRVALALDDIDKSLTSGQAAPVTPSRSKALRDCSSAIPRGVLAHTVMPQAPEMDRRVLRPRPNRRPARYHDSDSGLGTSLESTKDKQVASVKKDKAPVRATAVTRSAMSTTKHVGLSPRATNRIYEHTFKPLLAKPSLKDFHSLVLECPQKIQRHEIVCLRDIEKTLLLIAPERTKVAGLYLEFCLTSIRCIQATVEHLSDREQTRPADRPYTSGYFIDLVEQIHQYAEQLADAKEKKDSGETSDMNLDGSDEVKLHGGITVNGRPAELVRVKKNGEAFSIATGLPVELDEDIKSGISIKRSASEELLDEEEIMRSMARRKKNAPPEEYAPKRCREPGCNKEFKRPCDLTKHEKTHSRPWKCPDAACKYHEYGWPTEKERDRHINDKHMKDPPMYECQYKPCPYKSKRESNCKQHMEKAHGWTYVRTKTNGSGSRGRMNSAAPTLSSHTIPGIPTPPNEAGYGMPTPPRDLGAVAYPGQFDFNSALIPNDHFGHVDLPQEIHLDYSPVDNATPSTDSMDHNSAYQDMGQELMYTPEDIDLYAAHAQIPNVQYTKEMAHDFLAFSAAELRQTAPPAHISPTGHGNAMLYTPSSLAEVDEGFCEDFSASAQSGSDFVLYPRVDLAAKAASFEPYMDDIPSLAGGFSQANSQQVMQQMGWQAPLDYPQRSFSQQ